LIVSDAIIAALGYEADTVVPLGMVAVGVGVDAPMSEFGPFRKFDLTSMMSAFEG
jgi:hypothetical protein